MAVDLAGVAKELATVKQRAADAQVAFAALGGAAKGLKLEDVTKAIRAVEAEEKRAAAERVKAHREAVREMERLERQRAETVRAAFAAGARGAEILRAGFAAFGATVSALQTNVVGFVAKANPGVVLRFQIALDDLQAVIGRALLPTLNQFTAILRAMGGAVAGLDGGGQKVIASIAAGTVGLVAFGAAALAVQTIMTGGLLPIFAAVGGAVGGFALASSDLKPVLDSLSGIFVGAMNTIGAAIGAFTGSPAFGALVETFGEVVGLVAEMGAQFITGLMPVFNVVSGVLASLAPLVPPVVALFVNLSPMGVALKGIAAAAEFAGPYLIAFARVLTDVGRTVYNSLKTLLAFVGFTLPDFDNPAKRGETGSSVGASVRSTSTQDVSSVLQKARESAYMMGAGAKDDPAKRTANGMDTLNATATKIEGEIKRFIKELPAEIGKAVAAAWEAVKQNAPQAAINAIASAAATPEGRGATYAISPGLGAAMDAARFLREKFGN